MYLKDVSSFQVPAEVVLLSLLLLGQTSLWRQLENCIILLSELLGKKDTSVSSALTTGHSTSPYIYHGYVLVLSLL